MFCNYIYLKGQLKGEKCNKINCTTHKQFIPCQWIIKKGIRTGFICGKKSCCKHKKKPSKYVFTSDNVLSDLNSNENSTEYTSDNTLPDLNSNDNENTSENETYDEFSDLSVPIVDVSSPNVSSPNVLNDISPHILNDISPNVSSPNVLNNISPNVREKVCKDINNIYKNGCKKKFNSLSFPTRNSISKNRIKIYQF